MATTISKDTYGLRILQASDPAVITLRRTVRPSNHGHKVWPASWLLIDYLQHSGLAVGQRVLDLGCGWGSVGIYCALQPRTTVTCVDADNDVHPYLALMASRNQVTVAFRNLTIDQVRRDTLRHTDVLIAADICFCDSLIDPMRKLIARARHAGVRHILIADPGRWPFDDLAELFQGKKGVDLLSWQTTRPATAAGKILKISFR